VYIKDKVSNALVSQEVPLNRFAEHHEERFFNKIIGKE
jgi:hypothetical protein